MDDFVEYRETEAAETDLYTRWSHEASGSDIDTLDDVENKIVEVAHDASADLNELLMAGMQLSAEILQFENASGQPFLDQDPGNVQSLHNHIDPGGVDLTGLPCTIQTSAAAAYCTEIADRGSNQCMYGLRCVFRNRSSSHQLAEDTLCELRNRRRRSHNVIYAVLAGYSLQPR